MQKLTSRLIPLAMLFLASLVSVIAEAQQETMFGAFAAPGTGSDVVFARNSRITFSRVTWYFLGSITSCSFRIEKSDFGTTWADLIPLQDCSSEGKFEFITPVINQFLRFNASTVTGGGTVFMFWEGFAGAGCGIDYNPIVSAIESSDPAVGAELLKVIPPSERWRVHSTSFSLQTNSTAIDREVFLTLSSDEGKLYFRTFADGVVKAGQKGIFTTVNLGFVGTVGLGPSSIHQPVDERTIMVPIQSGPFIPGGHVFATNTNGMQLGPSGDDYSPAIFFVERCPN